MPIIYANGRYVSESRALVPANDAALFWGIGLFEVTRAYDGVPFRLADHVRRMKRSAKQLGLKAKLPKLEPVVRTLLKKNRLRDGYVRITLTQAGTLMVHARPWESCAEKAYRVGAALRVLPWRRDPLSPLAGHKTLNYYENMLGRWNALASGAIDALYLGLRKEVLEGTCTNIFLVKRGRLVTPGLEPGILPGVTRKCVLEAARRAGIGTVERVVTLRQLQDADEVFVTNAMIEIMPVSRIESHRIGVPGLVTRKIAEAYRDMVRKECGEGGTSARRRRKNR